MHAIQYNIIWSFKNTITQRMEISKLNYFQNILNAMQVYTRIVYTLYVCMYIICLYVCISYTMRMLNLLLFFKYYKCTLHKHVNEMFVIY